MTKATKVVPIPLKEGFISMRSWDAPVGARDEICDELGGTAGVLVEPCSSRSCPLCGHGHGGLGRDISCRVPTHAVCHNPDATVIQKSQCILVRGANMPGLSSTDPGPSLGVRHGATSIGCW